MYKIIAVVMALAMVFVPIRHPVSVLADHSKGFPIQVSIESYDKTLLRGQTTAFTFKEAIQKLAEENGMELTLTQNGSQSKVYSVNNVRNSLFKGNDGWYGCIYRKDSLLTPVDFLNYALEAGDTLVLFYGEPDKTKVLSVFQMELQNDRVSFTALAEQTEWIFQNGSWAKDTVIQQIHDAKIRLSVPGGTQKVLNTGLDGSASTLLTQLGVYKYYAEGYVFNQVPHIVRTCDSYFFYGVEDKSRLTRGEAAAFIVNTYNPEGRVGENHFIDVDETTPRYAEISRAVSAGIVSGYEDGTFRPDQPVTLLQFCVMLSAFSPVSEEQQAEIPGVPSWAQKAVNRLLAGGILMGIPLDWDDFVSVEQLMRIYMNTH